MLTRSRQDLLREKQQAFAEYKVRTDAQLKQVAELEKQVSRLTLENGLLKTELDQGHKTTLTLEGAQDEHGKAVKELQEAMQTALNAKAETAAENERLRVSLADLQQRIQLTSGLEAQLKEMRSRRQRRGNSLTKLCILNPCSLPSKISSNNLMPSTPPSLP